MASKKKIITSDDILGKEAVDTDGEILGVVMKLHIDKENKKMVGITIDQGFMKPDLFVGMSYIKNFGVDTVFLSRVPADKFKGLDVLDSKGKLLGKVAGVKSQRHKVVEIIVSKKGITRDRFLVPSKHIEEIGESVVLKKSFKAVKIEK
ncbi:PRC-barrel domain-containing protein [Candidatus Woesearchaeota archaeon]|nr:PRC-barrel domain-containing protein [Candidatus Woesearchaeota archaeon]